MLFIGDHPFNDCPRDLRVVFHLEINALERPALQLERLIQELQKRGNGSFIRGYKAIAADCSLWRFWNWPVFQSNQPMLRTVSGIDPLALMTGPKINPILAFEKEPIERAAPDLLTFTPSQLQLPEMPESLED
ncbi:MAG: hypothetical protein P1V97_19720, partial [Planctomycetota bacterium]|nr:hypothetical protein [Planctomycetota bacterium]